jgi:hypothetical protein
MNGETRQRPHVNPADLAAHIIAATYCCQADELSVGSELARAANSAELSPAC